MMKFAEEYRRMKIPFLFDPGMQLRWLDGDQLKTAFAGASIIIGNDYEISVMERKTGIPDLHNFSEEKIIITTLGESGSRVTQYGQSVTVRSAAVSQVLDPAGAGDAYRAGFLAGFLRKFRLEVCAQMGSVAAAYTVEKPGTSTHYFTPDDFVMRYEVNYEDELEL
jgi:adenosine kinase